MDLVRVAHSLIQLLQIGQPLTGINVVESIQHIHSRSTMQIPRIESSDNPERVCPDIASHPPGNGNDHTRIWLDEMIQFAFLLGKDSFINNSG